MIVKADDISYLLLTIRISNKGSLVGAAATDGAAHQPGAAWQKPRRGWPERVAAARRRGSRVAASSRAPLSCGGGGGSSGGGGFLCPNTSLGRAAGAGGAAGKGALRPRAPLPRAVCTRSFRASQRLWSGGDSWQCPPRHPLSDGRSGCCRRHRCRVALRPIHRRQRNGKIRGAEAENERGGAALPGAGSRIRPLPPPLLRRASSSGARKEAAVPRRRRRRSWSRTHGAQPSAKQSSGPGESFPFRAAGLPLLGNSVQGLGCRVPRPSRRHGDPQRKTALEKSRNE
ncbi:uncharacterized protein LOC112484331 [Pteropus alecto]|uniref:uncharacterized protein LOC112484331 n=1 Tax=Pteropus alecto TaxID=9402 RepID=UPI000D536112|nr:uncharacterized protein LOC112484331 [Pteropus alecto]